MIEIIPGIYSVEVYNDTKRGTGAATVFLIPGKEGIRSLMIDAGFANEGSRSELTKAIESLGIRYDLLDVVITHKHHDHCGMAGVLAGKGAVIYMNPVEDRHRYDCLSCRYSHSAMKEQWDVLKTVGITPDCEPEIWERYMEVNERVEQNKHWFFDIEDFPYESLTEHQEFHVGEFRFITLPLKGHTLGQMGLYDPDKKVLFCADQVINGTVPIVATTHVDERLLTFYFDSLAELKRDFADYLVYSAHDGRIEDLNSVVDEISYSYLKKLDIVKRVLMKAGRPMTVKEIACQVYGIGRVPDDDNGFIKLKLVVSKTFSCLEYLYEKGLVQRNMEQETLYWESVG